MGLFINNDKHHNIFKNKEEINDTNQNYFRRDHLSELLKEQQKVNDSLSRSIHGLKKINQHQNTRQNMQWTEMNNQLGELKQLQDKHDNKANQMVQKILDLEVGNQELLHLFNNNKLSEQEWKEQINAIRKTNNEVMEQLKQYAITNEQIEDKVKEQIASQEQMNEQLLKQSETQADVINRLDNQEAISEKVLRQLDHLRTILFERTTYLSEKIENGYESMATYVTQLITKSDLPLLPHGMYMKEKKHKEDIN